MQKFDITPKETWQWVIDTFKGMIGKKADKTEIPTALPNPQPITFSGTVPEATYDGSKAVNVVLPSAGVNYSLEERRIGTWIDGKPLYEKTIDFGNLPNTTIKEVPHGVGNIDIVWVHTGYSYDSSSKLFFCFVWTNSSTSGNNGFNFYASPQNVFCQTMSNRSSQVGYVIIRYTKTTD